MEFALWFRSYARTFPNCCKENDFLVVSLDFRVGSVQGLRGTISDRGAGLRLQGDLLLKSGNAPKPHRLLHSLAALTVAACVLWASRSNTSERLCEA
eukprot:4420184-Amphidinium_carterae.1